MKNNILGKDKNYPQMIKRNPGNKFLNENRYKDRGLKRVFDSE